MAFVGYDARVENLINVLNAKTNSGYKLVGIIAGPADADSQSVQYLGKSRDVFELVQTHRLDTLFIVSPTVPNDTILQILHACEGVPVQINLLPELSEFIRDGRETITFFDGIPVLRLRESPMQGGRGIVKRLIDIVFSTFALIGLSPLMLAIAIAIRLTSPGKAIFRQERVGRAGKPFSIYKFRSMQVDAEKEVGHVWAGSDDPRQTPLGKFLRRWSLDELPQFFQCSQGRYESRRSPSRDVWINRYIQ